MPGVGLVSPAPITTLPVNTEAISLLKKEFKPNPISKPLIFWVAVVGPSTSNTKEPY